MFFSEEDRLFKDSVLSFAKDEVEPGTQEREKKKEIPQSLIQKFFQMGLMGIDVPEKYGGSGGSFTMTCLAIETLSQFDPSVAVMVDVQNTLVNSIFLNYGNEEQKKEYLPLLCSKFVGAYALSESSSGSDAFSLKTSAKKDGDEFILNGQKLWITNAKEADIFIVFANVDFDKSYKGITAFIVEKDRKGLIVGKTEDKLGIRASSTCELVFDGVKIPKKNMIYEMGKGYQIAIQTLNAGRIGIGAQMLGLSQGAYDKAKFYVKTRKQFQKMLSEFQAVQFQIAEMRSFLEMMRLSVYDASQKKDQGKDLVIEASICKYMTSIYAEKITSQAINLLGGNGFTSEYLVEKLYRDAKIGQIYEGTSNMQLQTIAKKELA